MKRTIPLLLLTLAAGCVRTTQIRTAAAVPAAPAALLCARAQAQSLGYAASPAGRDTSRFTAERVATGDRLLVSLGRGDTLRVEAVGSGGAGAPPELGRRLAAEVGLVARSCGVLGGTASVAPR